MQLALVQIGDLHIKTGSEDVLKRVNAIVDAVTSLDPPKLEVVLLWTGDLTYSGTSTQFSAFTKFVDALENAFKSHPNISFLGSSYIPGNHDCDFEQTNDARAPLIASISGSLGTLEPDGAVVRQISHVQELFFTFLSSRRQQFENRLLWQSVFHGSTHTVHVRCCNTAWMCELPEKRGLLYPDHIVSPITSGLVVSLLHHPFGWMEPDNAKLFRRALEKDSHIIFSGHEHESDTYKRIGKATTTQYVEGSALMASGADTGFNTAIIDSKGGQYFFYKLTWQSPLYKPGDPSCFSFARDQRMVENTFQRSPEFEYFLEEVTTPYTHPRKSDLRLSDLYVYPDLSRTRLSRPDELSQGSDTIRSEDVLEELTSCPIARISGSQGCGKSALGRLLCRDLLDLKGVVPVFLQASDVTSYDETKLSLSLRQVFSKQYSPSLVDNFQQLSKQHKAVIIDDWHKVKLNQKGQKAVTGYLAAKFGCVILLDSSSTFIQQVDSIISSSDGDAPRIYEFKQFGFGLRGDLITKWHSLGRELEVSEGDLARDISLSERVLSTLIGRGIVPSIPLFILSALQLQEDAFQKGAMYGSYGHIYQSLITSRLARSAAKNIALKMSFLAAMAAKMFESRSLLLSAAQVNAVHNAYEKAYNYTVDKEPLLKDLALSGLISLQAGEIKFSYKYAYYFFVASAFKNAIDDEENEQVTRNILSQLSLQAALEDNANILIFFLYLSKDRRLIREIMANSRNIFGKTVRCDLVQDVDFINVMPLDLLPVNEPSPDVASNVKEHRRAQDEATDLQNSSPNNDASSALLAELDFAMRSVEIMGQVLRNFPTDLKGDLKIALVQETHALGFRVIGALLDLIRDRSGSLHEEFTRRLSLETAFVRKSEERRKKLIRQIVSFIAELGVFGVIKKLSASLGSDELSDTYEFVRKEAGEDHIPTRLVDLAISLDHFARIPEADVSDLNHRLEKNPVIMMILRLVVAEHLALFPVDMRQRQRLVALLKLGPLVGLGNRARLMNSTTS